MKADRSNRGGYTLIELLATMIAASILLASLAATVLVSANLLDAPTQDDGLWRDREIADRVAADLRYSTGIDETPSYGFQLTRANVSTGISETASYEAYLQGLTRQVNAGPVMQLDEVGPSHSFSVDGYSGATYTPNDQPVRVRSSSSASGSNLLSQVTCEYPPGCQDGDIVVMVIATNALVYADASGWNTIAYIGTVGLRSRTLYRIYDSSAPGPVQTNVSGFSNVSVAMIAIENGVEGDPTNVYSYNTGLANVLLPGTHPSPLEQSTGTLPQHLNIGILTAVGNPWISESLGVASYSDVVRESTPYFSVGIVVRNGVQPDMTTAPKYWFQTTGYWIQTAIRVGNGG